MNEWLERIKELEKALAKLVLENERLVAKNKQLAELVEVMKERLGLDSTNSSKPPSSDPPNKNKEKERRRKRAGKGKPKRKRGGQKGHKGHRRQLLDPSQVDVLVDLYPSNCENCWQSLPEVADPYAKRHQVTELPPVKPHTTEYRWHEVQCPCCRYRTRAKQDGDVRKSAFGPRLSSILAMLTGIYHLSRRQAQRAAADLFGVHISLGALSKLEERVSNAT